MHARKLRSSLCFVLCLGVALGCEETEDPSASSPKDAAGRSVLATVDGLPITRESVETSIRLELYDLELAKHRRRLEQLEILIADRLGPEISPGSREWEDRVALLIEAPPRPRIDLPDDAGPIRGPKEAPVTLVEFVDFDSAHCRRIQPVLMRILERYPDRVRLLVRDLPLPYHRNAWPAALAGHCAEEQEAYWAYHDMLLLEQPSLAGPDLSRTAERLGLDLERFEACFDSELPAKRIQADLELARALGIRRAPTLFVNGLYLSGHPSFEEIDRLVRDELTRLGHDPRPSPSGPSRPSDGSSQESGADASTPRSNGRPALPGVPPDLVGEPEVVVTLSRGEVDRVLEDRRALDRRLAPSAGTFSGERLLKVQKLHEGDFHSRLGLEEGDVVMIVNGELVTFGSGSIWDAFASGESVTMLVMRRGRPHVYEYRIR